VSRNNKNVGFDQGRVPEEAKRMSVRGLDPVSLLGPKSGSSVFAGLEAISFLFGLSPERDKAFSCSSTMEPVSRELDFLAASFFELSI